MSTGDTTIEATQEETRSAEIWLWVSGLAAIALGALAILYPFAATLAADYVIAIVLGVSGLVHIARAVFGKGVESAFWTLVFGVLSLVAAAFLLLFPFQGAVALTVVLALFLISGGVAKMIATWYLSPRHRRQAGLPRLGGWAWLALSALVSIILGLLLFIGLPETAIWAIGLLVGIDLVFLGISEIALARAIRRTDGRTRA